MQVALMKQEDRRNLQMCINEKGGQRLVVDGAFGPKSIAGLRVMQSKLGLAITGEYDDETHAAVGEFIEAKYLVGKHYEAAAAELGVEVAKIRAVVEVEAAGDGFLKDGRCVILFERHKFYQALVRKKGLTATLEFAKANPDICGPTSGAYVGDEGEWPRLARAEKFDLECARSAASWGMFQIMGFNYKSAGYPSAFTFSEAMKVSEFNQLRAFVGFIKDNTNLWTALRNGNWTAFAKGYNGPAYWKHKYDERMATAYGLWVARLAKAA